MKALQKLIHEINNVRKSSEANINTIIATQEKCNYNDKSTIMQQKLKTVYKNGINDAQQEEALLRQALNKIHEIHNIRNERRIQARNAGNKETIGQGTLMKMLKMSAQSIPLFIGKPGEKAPPLCGSIPCESNYIAKPGDMVAAWVKNTAEGENWIIAEVVQYIASKNKYEVDDIDGEGKNRHVLSKRLVVPLPLMRANPETDGYALFPEGTIVLALYPSTTCFYKGIIHKLPENAADSYQILFEDHKYPTGYSPPYAVAQLYVMPLKPSKKLHSLSTWHQQNDDENFIDDPPLQLHDIDDDDNDDNNDIFHDDNDEDDEIF